MGPLVAMKRPRHGHLPALVQKIDDELSGEAVGSPTTTAPALLVRCEGCSS